MVGQLWVCSCLLPLCHGPPLPPARAPSILHIHKKKQKNTSTSTCLLLHRFFCFCVHCRLYRCSFGVLPTDIQHIVFVLICTAGYTLLSAITHIFLRRHSFSVFFFCFPHPSPPLPSVSAPARLSVFLHLFLTLPSSSSSSVPLRHSLSTLMYDAMKQNVTVNFFPPYSIPVRPVSPHFVSSLFFHIL